MGKHRFCRQKAVLFDPKSTASSIKKHRFFARIL